MADGMDKAFFLSNLEENLTYAYETLWHAAATMAGTRELEMGMVPLRAGGFALISKLNDQYQAWMISSTGELRALEGYNLVRICSFL